MLSVGEIKKFIENDASSRAKQFAKTGVRYYEGDHDIKDYRIFFIDAEGEIQDDYLAPIRAMDAFTVENT